MITDEPEIEAPAQPEARAEKVRGMNASLAGEVKAGGLRERDPGRLHLTRRQIAFAVVLAVMAVMVAVLTVNSVMAGTRTFQAAVTTSKVYDLNFPNEGKLTSIAVHLGQDVRAGQVIATQDDTQAAQQLAAAEGVVKADQAALAQAQSPQLTPAQMQQDQLEVNQAQTALANAQADLTAAEASGKAEVQAAQAAVTAAQTLEASDQARYSQACPNGPVPPDPSLTGSAEATAQSEYTHCQDLQLQVDQQAAAVTQASAQVPQVEAQAQSAINQAQATVNSAQAAANLASFQESLQSSPTDQMAIDQAEANLSQAQAQLAAAQEAVTSASIVAPDSGTVAAIWGQVGEYVGPDGVHQYAAPSALPSGSVGFSLFPETTSPSGGAASSTTGFEPVVEIVGGAQQVTAQVPESDVSALPVGHQAKVSIPALNTSVTGTVTAVVLTPTRTTSAVEYDVQITLNRAVPGLLPGMSASVST